MHPDNPNIQNDHGHEGAVTAAQAGLEVILVEGALDRVLGLGGRNPYDAVELPECHAIYARGRVRAEGYLAMVAPRLKAA